MTETKINNAIAFTISGQQYRIRRYNSMNLIIERQNDKCHRWAKPDADGWSVYGYYGNSLPALANGLAKLAAEHTPNADDQLLKQIEALRQAVEDSTAAIVGTLATAKKCNKNARIFEDLK